jgi:hypothetical protein
MNPTGYKLNGKVVSRDEFLAGRQWGTPAPMTANTYQDHEPLVSDGLGCMKKQVPEMRETIHKHNIKGVVVRDNGQVEITSRRGRAELCRVRGLADMDAGYSDHGAQ